MKPTSPASPTSALLLSRTSSDASSRGTDDLCARHGGRDEVVWSEPARRVPTWRAWLPWHDARRAPAPGAQATPRPGLEAALAAGADLPGIPAAVDPAGRDVAETLCGAGAIMGGLIGALGSGLGCLLPALGAYAGAPRVACAPAPLLALDAREADLYATCCWRRLTQFTPMLCPADAHDLGGVAGDCSARLVAYADEHGSTAGFAASSPQVDDFWLFLGSGGVVLGLAMGGAVGVCLGVAAEQAWRRQRVARAAAPAGRVAAAETSARALIAALRGGDADAAARLLAQPAPTYLPVGTGHSTAMDCLALAPNEAVRARLLDVHRAQRRELAAARAGLEGSSRAAATLDALLVLAQPI